jgi:UDP-N-acetylmuramoyl-L-alanyl-D-glutamate--2,6-diaminopimelate ligase
MNWKAKIKLFIPDQLLKIYHFFLAGTAAVFYQFPSRKLIVIGVTGTSGKSTVVEMTARILQEANYKVASLSSICFRIGEKSYPNELKMTMPGRFQLQKFLSTARKDHCRYAVIEVTSEGIKQCRHRFIDFDIAVFTNLSPEHIERHGSFTNYRKTKEKLFQSLSPSWFGNLTKKKRPKIIIVNLDDQYVHSFLRFKAERKIGFSIKASLPGRNIELLSAKKVISSPGQTTFSVNGREMKLNLDGLFNVYNALAALAIGWSQGINLKSMQQSLASIEKIPGRMEIVVKKPCPVIVDYAHTPVALEKAYQAARHYLGNNGKLICVLGSCGGGRDKWKRPVFGKIAGHYCQKVILTNEDPYDEDPERILMEIKSGLKNFPIKDQMIILDREKAINRALSLGGPKDVVIITGKGSESSMCVKDGRKIAWDDRKVVRRLTKIN